eukprot:3208033-Amphidinium_carterae.1
MPPCVDRVDCCPVSMLDHVGSFAAAWFVCETSRVFSHILREVEADLMACYAERPALAYVDS